MNKHAGSARVRRGRKTAGLLTMFAVAVTAVACAATGSVFLAGPAQAAGCAPIIDKVTVSDVVIYGTSASRALTTVVTHDPCSDQVFGEVGIFDVSGKVYLSDGGYVDVFFNHSTTSTWPGASGAYFDKYSAIGRGSASVEVTDTDINTTYRDAIPFYVRRNVVVTAFDASPEPVRKGAAIKLTGSFSRLSVGVFGAAKYVPYAGHQVDLYFRPLTSSKYTKVSSALTTSTGAFARNITATVDGCWKAYSVQTASNVGRWSSVDCVDVQ
jgi:hypothetical protein